MGALRVLKVVDFKALLAPWIIGSIQMHWLIPLLLKLILEYH
jgi:hypothetical protein